MRRSFLVPVLAAVLLLPACADLEQPTTPVGARFAAGGLSSGAPITVMSRNLYLGADIDALIKPGADPRVVIPAALGQLQHNDFVARAQHIAMEIATRQPEAVGLQEVTHYVFATAAGKQTLDFLNVLQQYLGAMGAQYDVAVHQNNVSLLIPVGAAGIDSVTYTDGDAILVRHDIAWSDPAHGHYPTQVELNVGGVTFDNLRGWNAVTIHVNGSDVRFVNTHLEIQTFRATQEQQARELADMLAEETLPIVLVGDFNSAANPSAPADSKTASYQILRDAGFADLELRDPHGISIVTCCHLADLSDVVPTFNQRLDLVLARFTNDGFGGQANTEVIVGQRFLVDPDHTPASGDEYYLWPSDHAAVFGKIWPAPGLMAARP